MIFSTDDGTGHEVITTRHFRIETETTINRPDLERFAKVLESVPQVVEGFPLPLWAPPRKERTEVVICRDAQSYSRAGGQAGTAGFYNGYKQHALIRADYFLRPPSVQPTRLRPRPNQDILVHEMVHMTMQGFLMRTPPWFYEGVAEYFAVCHQGNGWYLFRDLQTQIRDHFRKSYSTDEGGRFVMPPVSDILDLDPQEWMKWVANLGPDSYRPYGMALLLTHYYFHGGEVRKEKLAAHLSEIKHVRRRDRLPEFPIQDPEEIQKRLANFWGPKGVNLVFRKLD